MYEENPLSIVKFAGVLGCVGIYAYFFKDWRKKMARKYMMIFRSISREEEFFSYFERGDLKLVLVVQNGLKMGKGKMAEQCAHASVMAYQNSSIKNPKLFKEWLKTGQRKVVVKVESEEAMMELAAKARRGGHIINMVYDAGRTQIPSGSRTVLAIGPGVEQNIDKITGHLKLL